MATGLWHFLVILIYAVQITFNQSACDFDFEYGPSVSSDIDIADAPQWIDHCFGPYQTSGLSIPFKGQVFTHYYVCIFGLLCFGSSHPSNSIDIPNEGTSNGNKAMYCLALYYTDLVLRQGNIWHMNVNSTADISIMNFAKDVVFNKTGNEINPLFMIKVTWDEMHHYSSYQSDLNQKATFQAVYITDGSKNYVLYYYKDGGMTITVGDVVIGSIVGGNVTGLNNTDEFLRSPDENLILGDCKGQYILPDTTTMTTTTPTNTTTPTITSTAPSTTSNTETPSTNNNSPATNYNPTNYNFYNSNNNNHSNNYSLSYNYYHSHNKYFRSNNYYHNNNRTNNYFYNNLSNNNLNTYIDYNSFNCYRANKYFHTYNFHSNSF